MRYSGALADFATEEVFHLVGDDVAEMVAGFEEMDGGERGYDAESCVGKIWENETANVAASLVNNDVYRSGVWKLEDGTEIGVPDREE